MARSQSKTLSQETLKLLERFDSCTISNAIEQFELRTRNEGFVKGSVRCMFPQFPPRVGYAATARIRTSSTPIGGRWYYDRIDWWSYLRTIPAPRFVVAEDVDPTPGLGAWVGQIHANIFKALDCCVYLTNGAVRDLPGAEEADFQLFAGSVSVSHAYAHVIEYGEPVEIGGLQIKPGDLLHGDQHGVVLVPISIAEEIPRVADDVVKTEQDLVAFCRSKEFSFDKLAKKIESLSGKFGAPEKDLK